MKTFTVILRYPEVLKEDGEYRYYAATGVDAQNADEATDKARWEVWRFLPNESRSMARMNDFKMILVLMGRTSLVSVGF